MSHAISISQGRLRIRFYSGNIEYLNDQLQHIAFPNGRLVAEYNTSGASVTGYRSEYFRTDHLGNTRLTFSDFNQDGVISWKLPNSGPAAQESEITSENHYYPFGLGQKGPWYASVAPDNKYRYNGKEWNDEWGLNMYDYGARGYMPDLGRWGGVDALAERYYAWSGYNYVMGNPIRLIDPDGMRVSLFDRLEAMGAKHGKSIDDYYVFDEKGRYLRTEINDKEDQIVIENSKTGNRDHVLFNDPEYDSNLMANTLKWWGRDALEMQLLFFVTDSDIEEMMTDSKIQYRSYIGRRLFTASSSYGGKMDFSVYSLPGFVGGKIGKYDLWLPSDVGLQGAEKRTPFFIFGNDKVNAYNWLDAGNWMWGNAVNRLGGSHLDADKWARSYNKNDSFADLNAISNGWFYQAGYRSSRNIPTKNK